MNWWRINLEKKENAEISGILMNKNIDERYRSKKMNDTANDLSSSFFSIFTYAFKNERIIE